MKGGTLARVWWGGKAWGKLCKSPRASYSGGMANSSEADSEELRRFLDKARERSANYHETAERTRREAAAALERAQANRGTFRMWGAPDGH